jgi:hypothetical protein
MAPISAQVPGAQNGNLRPDSATLWHYPKVGNNSHHISSPGFFFSVTHTHSISTRKINTWIGRPPALDLPHPLRYSSEWLLLQGRTLNSNKRSYALILSIYHDFHVQSRLASWEASDGSGTTRTERNTMSVTWLIGPCTVLILAQTFIPGPWDVVQDFYSSLADAAPPKGPRNDLGIPVDHLNLYEPWPARDRDHSTHSHPRNQASESSTDIWGTSSMSSHSTDSFDVYGSQSFQHGVRLVPTMLRIPLNHPLIGRKHLVLAPGQHRCITSLRIHRIHNPHCQHPINHRTQQPHRHHPRVGPERIPASLRAAEE